VVDVISVEATLNTSADRVWTALADPAARADWWPGMTFDAVNGAALQERWSEDGVDYVARGTVRDVVPNELLRFTWSDASWEAPTTVTVKLEETRSGTLVRVSEEGLAQLSQGTDVAREHQAGWRWHLDQLRGHIQSR
jgi:uncharacterized protein YndB with AHSA1/START domain